MLVYKISSFALVLAAISVIPSVNVNAIPVILNRNEGLIFNIWDVDKGSQIRQWPKITNIFTSNKFQPDIQNVLHLFTRQNPYTSQPMLLNSNHLLDNSNFNASRRTIIIVHGWTQSANSDLNSVLVPAFLAAEDVNVFAYDWSIGAEFLGNGPVNAVESGLSLARVIDWICARTSTTPSRLHILGFSLGAHLSAVAGRNVRSGKIPYMTALDPGANMEDSGQMFGADAAVYTEAIHTNVGIMGHDKPLAHVDFYPNGGAIQPGCGANFICNHYRSYNFYAETISNNKDWLWWTRCGSYKQARLGLCNSTSTLRMGGLSPKTGYTGIYHLITNAEQPYQQCGANQLISSIKMINQTNLIITNLVMIDLIMIDL